MKLVDYSWNFHYSYKQLDGENHAFTKIAQTQNYLLIVIVVVGLDICSKLVEDLMGGVQNSCMTTNKLSWRKNDQEIKEANDYLEDT